MMNSTRERALKRGSRPMALKDQETKRNQQRDWKLYTKVGKGRRCGTVKSKEFQGDNDQLE